VLRLCRRGSVAKLDTPAIRVRGVMRRLRPGDDPALTVRRTARDDCVDANTSSTCRLGFTVGSGWTFLFYSQTPKARLQTPLNSAWMVAFVLPIGFGACRCAKSLLALCVPALGIILPCTVAQLFISPSEIIASVAAMIVGIGSAWFVSNSRWKCSLESCQNT